MAAAIKSSQDIIDEFWKSSICAANLSKACAVLPPNVYSQLVGRQVPKGATAAEPVNASYEAAKKDCEKKVAQIVKECQMVNRKYSDPYFDLEKRDMCLFPLGPLPFDSPDDADSSGVRYNIMQGGDSVGKLVIDPSSAGYDVTQNGNPVGKLSIYGPQPALNPPSVKRVRDIFDNPRFFVDGADAKDIRQGREGDCWFLSALSTLCKLESAEHLINRICVARDQEVGVYGFLLFRDGEWTSVIIDDKLYLREPDFEFADSKTRSKWEENRIRVNSEEEYRKEFQSNSRSLYFAQSAHPDETWVPLIEKAFAKAHGDYGAIDGGSVGEGVEDLTGGISTIVRPGDILSKDKFWNECFLKVNVEFLIGCETAGWDDPLGQGRDGIHGSHAYSVLSAVNYGKERLVLMKNPWGAEEWSGPWSDGSSEWTTKSIEDLGHTFGNDGIFWIRYEDMLRKYALIWRTRLFPPEWRVTQQWASLEIPWAGEYQDTKFEVTITKKTPTVIALSKLDDRYFQGLAGQYVFQLSFRVHRAGEDDYIMRTFGEKPWYRSTSCELVLEPGKYDVCLKITAIRDDDADKVEDVIKDKWLGRRDKLLQIGQSHDLAHAKAQVVKEEKPKRPATEMSVAAEAAKAGATTSASITRPEMLAQNNDFVDDRGVASYEDEGASVLGPPAQAADGGASEKMEDDTPDEPWSAVAVVGLRVYCKDEDATIRIVRPKPPVVVEAKLDVDDPARDAAKGAEVKGKEKEEVEETKEEEVTGKEKEMEETKEENEDGVKEKGRGWCQREGGLEKDVDAKEDLKKALEKLGS